MLKARAVRWCLALLLLLLPGAASAQDPGEELREAASAGDVAKVRQILDRGVDVDAANSYGGTALAFASRRGHVEVVRLLLERGADPHRQNPFNGSTPILAALRQGHPETARLLLAKAREVDLQMLMAATLGGQGELVKAVLDKGKFTPEQLTNVLFTAEQEGKGESVKTLEAAGARPLPPATFQVDPETLRSYAGTYEAADGFVITVAVQNGKLTAEAGDEILDFGALDKTTFRAERFPDFKLIFNAGNGKVTGLTLEEGDSNPMRLKKKDGK